MDSQNLESHGAKLATIDEKASLPPWSRLALRELKNALLDKGKDLVSSILKNLPNNH